MEMEQNKKPEKKSSAFIPRIALFLIGALVVLYTIYHVSSIFAEDVTTISAGISTEIKSVTGNGYVFRDEALLYSDNSGVVDYLVSDGAKVGKGQAIANVYEGGSAEERELIILIDRYIALLEGSDAAVGTDMTKLREAASDTYYSIVKQLSGGELGGLSKNTDKMLKTLNMIQSLIDGDSSSVSSSLESLRRSRSEILSGAGNGSYNTAVESGYFYKYADGYEGSFNTAVAKEGDGEALYALVSGEHTPAEVSSLCYGKMAESSEWYFVIPLSADEAGYFDIGSSYSVKVISGRERVVPMTLERALGYESEAVEKIVLLVFSCDHLPDGEALERNLSISVDVGSVSGIYVPRSAVAYMDGQRGVYILKGSVVQFRAIEVAYIVKDYYLVDADFDDDESEYAYLTQNELIITNGQNMFDGRIMD